MKYIVAAIAILAILVFAIFEFDGVGPGIDGNESDIILPEGFAIETSAQNLGDSKLSVPGPNTGPRMMIVIDDNLFVSLSKQGKVVALADIYDNKRYNESITFIENLRNPHGLAFHNDWIYIAEENRIVRVKDGNKDLRADMETLQVLIDLPTGGHSTRTIKIHNGSLYVSIGSSCNVCYEDDERRAAIMKCGLDGKNCSVFAEGLRNAVDFIFHPITGEMYATENGRDLLGDDTPPDEINIVKEGSDYGWPICYGKQIHDTNFDKNVYVRNPCEDTRPSFVDLQAHSAPLGLAFYYGENFPEEYQGDLFVAYHGSWNRREPTGYKIVRIEMDNLSVEDFATGWLQGIDVLGRPVGIVIAEDGSMLVSDDNAGRIYRIYYSG